MARIEDAPGEQQVRVNIRFACWEQSRKPEHWVGLLSKWLGPIEDENATPRDDRVWLAQRVLADQATLSKDQLKAVAEALNRNVQDLYFENWPEMRPGLVVHENLNRLFADPGYQTKAELEDELEVIQSTLSRLIVGRQVPETTSRRRIANLIGFRDPLELDSSPNFLS